MKRLLTLLTMLTLLTLPMLIGGSDCVMAQTGPPRSDTGFFPIDELRPGMKAVGYTVFVGREPEPFDLEILGVLKGFPNPGQSAVLSRLIGDRMNHTGVFQGMSGSPVFVGNRLVGAVAFGYQFARDPIASITPIRQMIEQFEIYRDGKGRSTSLNSGDSNSARRITYADLGFSDGQSAARQDSPYQLAYNLTSPTSPVSVGAADGPGLIPIATPLAVSGIAPEVLGRFAPLFKSWGFNPFAGPSASFGASLGASFGGAAAVTDLKKSDSGTLKPGSTVVVPLIRGDYSVSAAGTVTWRDGNRIYAFGHPFMSLGLSDFPMHEGEVVTVLSSLASSFKLSYPTEMVGVVRGDRSAGIYGELGATPRMIPVEINLRTSRGESRKFSFDVVADRFLTPILLQMTMISTISSTERAIGDSTLLINGTIKLKDQPPIRLENRVAVTLNGPISATLAAVQPVGTIIASGFDDLSFEKITWDIDSQDVRQIGQIDRLWIDRSEVRRGETVAVQLFARTEGGREYVERFSLTIPTDAPVGPLQLLVGDGAALQSSDPRTGFTPKSIGQLVAGINRVRKAGRLYARLSQAEGGAMIRNEELPALPPSVLATLGSDRTVGGYTLTTSRIILEKDLPPTAYVISGQRTLKINVVQ